MYTYTQRYMRMCQSRIPVWIVCCMHASKCEVKHGLTLALLQAYLYGLLSYMLTCTV